MKQEIRLRNPIKINGEIVTVLTYDAEEIDSKLYARAEALKQTASGSAGNRAGAYELDYSFHLYLGFMAIVAVNPEIDVSDLERIKGRDLHEVNKIGRNFTLSAQEDSSEEQISDGRSDTTPDPIDIL